MTVVEELLCRSRPHGAGFTLVGHWCLLSSPFWCVFCERGWVVLWCGLKLATSLLILGPLGGGPLVQAKDSCYLCSVQGYLV